MAFVNHNSNFFSLCSKMNFFFFLTLVALFSLAYGNKCGGNCPSNTCSTCTCGTTPKIVDIGAWCGKYSGWNQKCCKCIVERESSGNANSVRWNDWNKSTDVGWQINSVNWPACNAGKAPCDPDSNLKCAIQTYKDGKNSWSKWVARKACPGC